MSRCAASAISLPVGGFPASEPGSGTVLVLARVQGRLSEAMGSGGDSRSEIFLVFEVLQSLS